MHPPDDRPPTGLLTGAPTPLAPRSPLSVVCGPTAAPVWKFRLLAGPPAPRPPPSSPRCPSRKARAPVEIPGAERGLIPPTGASQTRLPASLPEPESVWDMSRPTRPSAPTAVRVLSSPPTIEVQTIPPERLSQFLNPRVFQLPVSPVIDCSRTETLSGPDPHSSPPSKPVRGKPSGHLRVHPFDVTTTISTSILPPASTSKTSTDRPVQRWGSFFDEDNHSFLTSFL